MPLSTDSLTRSSNCVERVRRFDGEAESGGELRNAAAPTSIAPVSPSNTMFDSLAIMGFQDVRMIGIIRAFTKAGDDCANFDDQMIPRAHRLNMDDWRT